MGMSVARSCVFPAIGLLIAIVGHDRAWAQDKVHRASTPAAVDLVEALLPLIPQATADDKAALVGLLHGKGASTTAPAFRIDVGGIDCQYHVEDHVPAQCWVAVGGAPLIPVTGGRAKTLVRALLKAGTTEDAAMGGHRDVQVTELVCTVNDPSTQSARAAGSPPVSCHFKDPLEG